MLLLYYNPTKDNYYLRYYKSIHYDYKVGYKNQFDHEVVKILVIQGNRLVAVDDLQAFLLKRYRDRMNKQSLKKRLISKVISYLERL